MKNPKMTTILLVTLLAAAVFVDGYAGSSSRRNRRGDDYSVNKPRSQETITISGITSGSLNGQIRAGRQSFVITKNTKIYRTGEGAVELGTFVADTPVYAVCVIHKKVAYAKLVVVSNPRSPGDGVAGVLDPNEPL